MCTIILQQSKITHRSWRKDRLDTGAQVMGVLPIPALRHQARGSPAGTHQASLFWKHIAEIFEKKESAVAVRNFWHVFDCKILLRTGLRKWRRIWRFKLRPWSAHKLFTQILFAGDLLSGPRVAKIRRNQHYLNQQRNVARGKPKL